MNRKFNPMISLVLIASFLLVSCDLVSGSTPEKVEVTRVVEVTRMVEQAQQPVQVVVVIPTQAAPVSVSPTEPVTTSPVVPEEVFQTSLSLPSEDPTVSIDGIQAWGVPSEATNVERANSPFENTVGLKTDAFLAEPGKLEISNDACATTEWQERIKAAGGAIHCIDPSSQRVLDGEVAHFTLPEGGFTLASFNGADIRIQDALLSIPGKPNRNSLLLVRGLYSDAETPDDRNISMEVTNFSGGNALFTAYSGEPNGGFVSEGQWLQVAADSVGSGTQNCGASGCPETLAVFFDANTGALLILERTSSTANWELLFSNF